MAVSFDYYLAITIRFFFQKDKQRNSVAYHFLQAIGI